MKILIIIPAYNEAKKIEQVVAEIKNQDYDVLVVDDGSSDDTAKMAEQAGAVVLSHQLNRGQGASLKTGIKYALKKGYDTVVFFDADDQMDAKEIKMLITKQKETGVEVVLGSRFLGRAINIPFIKKIVLKTALFGTRLMTGLKITDVHNGFQLWTRDALKKIELKQDKQAYASELLDQISKKKLLYCEAPVTITYTNYSKGKGQKISNAFNILWDLVVKK